MLVNNTWRIQPFSYCYLNDLLVAWNSKLTHLILKCGECDNNRNRRVECAELTQQKINSIHCTNNLFQQYDISWILCINWSSQTSWFLRSWNCWNPVRWTMVASEKGRKILGLFMTTFSFFQFCGLTFWLYLLLHHIARDEK